MPDGPSTEAMGLTSRDRAMVGGNTDAIRRGLKDGAVLLSPNGNGKDASTILQDSAPTDLSPDGVVVNTDPAIAPEVADSSGTEVQRTAEARGPVDTAKDSFIKGLQGLEERYNKGEISPAQKSKVETALNYSQEAAGGAVGPKNSESWKAAMDVFQETGGDLTAAYEQMREQGQVVYDGEAFDIKTWEDKLVSASPEDKIKMEAGGLYAFKPSEKPAAEVNQEKQEMATVIATKTKDLQEKINTLKQEGKDASALESILNTLLLADKCADKDIGEHLKKLGLKALTSVEGMGDGLENVIKRLDPKSEGAKKYNEAVGKCDLTAEEKAWMEKGDFDSLMTSGAYKKVAGLTKELFGGDMTEGKLLSMVEGKISKKQIEEAVLKYGKDATLGIGGLLLVMLLAAIMAAGAAFNQRG